MSPIFISGTSNQEKNKLNVPLDQPLDETIVVNYGIDNYLSSSTVTFNILVCDHWIFPLPMLFYFEIFGEGQSIFRDTSIRLSEIFFPSSPNCMVGDGMPRLAMTEQGAFVTGTIVSIDSDYLNIDLSQG
jgi:hypothetical protein